MLVLGCGQQYYLPSATEVHVVYREGKIVRLSEVP